MGLGLWWWRKVRKANIPKEQRDVFERFGEAAIVGVLTSGLQPKTPELQKIYGDFDNRLSNARDWLTECRDSQIRREQRLETVEVAVLVFVTLGVVVEGFQLLHQLGLL